MSIFRFGVRAPGLRLSLPRRRSWVRIPPGDLSCAGSSEVEHQNADLQYRVRTS
jgi:hypothetical protein